MVKSLLGKAFTSLDKAINQNPLAQAAGNLAAKAIGADDLPSTTEQQYEALVHYFKYASTAYPLIIPGQPIIPIHPAGATLIIKLFDLFTDTHGFVARDDVKHEIVVAWRGSVTPANFLTDLAGVPVDWDAAALGAAAPAGVKMHWGFMNAWRSVIKSTMVELEKELTAFPAYDIVVTGHSLGGAMASLSALSIQLAYTKKQVRVYTYGAPRVGNVEWAAWANQTIPIERAFRVVHSADGVPTMAPRFAPFHFCHHGQEYWALSPHSPAMTKICVAPKGEFEDPHGSAKIPSMGINPPHLVYFGIPAATPFVL
jgi:hypothetical protein